VNPCDQISFYFGIIAFIEWKILHIIGGALCSFGSTASVRPTRSCSKPSCHRLVASPCLRERVRIFSICSPFVQIRLAVLSFLFLFPICQIRRYEDGPWWQAIRYSSLGSQKSGQYRTYEFGTLRRGSTFRNTDTEAIQISTTAIWKKTFPFSKFF
jgi:hypothetical protein